MQMVEKNGINEVRDYYKNKPAVIDADGTQEWYQHRKMI